MKKRKIYILFLAIGFVFGFVFYRFYQNFRRESFFIKSETVDPSYVKSLGKIFGNAYFDLFNDHNQFLDAFYKLKREKKIDNTTKILLIFDSHADMGFYANSSIDIGNEDIGDWVNTLLAEKNGNGRGEIDEIYWVLAKGDAIEKDQTLYIDYQTRTYLPEASNKNARTIQWHKRLIDDLPSFSGNKEILMTIDSDYFDFNGNGQAHNFVIHNSTKEELEGKLTDFVGKLDKLNIKPVFVGISRSPEYTAGMAQYLEVFYRYIGLESKTGTDYLVNYQHSNSDVGSHTQGAVDKIKTRLEVKDSQDIYDLQTIDILYGGFDYMIDIGHDSLELSRSIDILMLHDHLSKNQALDRLRKLTGNGGQTIILPGRNDSNF